MSRIILSLAIVSTVLLTSAYVLGWNVEPAAARTGESLFDLHFAVALGAMLFATLVHGITLTYFMGTGRWLEETLSAYSLPMERFERSRRLKYRVIGWMTLAFLSLLFTGACGAAAHVSTAIGPRFWWGIPVATWHFAAASVALTLNTYVHAREYEAVLENNRLIRSVVDDVRRIRAEHGLPC
ncbi:MAG: hypothetical protein D6725_01595 [Planctomycetota bacterium]|nr:MAG: hypothetical protein D6725_01595 [Planctomycetota bacterium]